VLSNQAQSFGFSILEVTGTKGNIISITGIDMMDDTPALDIKPVVKKDERD
jgi:tRNA (Thr-GGU) A37 N-methylase